MKVALFISVTMLFFPNATLASDLSGRAEELANSKFYRQQLIELLDSGTQDYNSILKCTTVLNEQIKRDGGIDATCATKEDVLHISISMGKNSLPQAVYICPVSQDEMIVKELIGLSLEKKSQSNGTLYNMGYTDGWIDGFVNRLFVFESDGERLACWDLGRR